VGGFRKFLLRGNLVDLAVAVVIGTAFTALVTALVKDLITPLIAAIGGKPNFSSLAFTLNHSRFAYGDFINAILAFLIIAAVVYFLVVLPYTTLRKRGEVEQADDAQIVLLTEIRDLLGQTNGSASGKHGGPATIPPPEHGPRADAESL
jgi:large conductance mechanosensitive channel